MFGYVIVNKPELKIKDFDLYQSFYCGLCETLKERYGRFAQLSLNFDMTFLIFVLSGLYESEIVQTTSRCVIHPAKKHLSSTSEWSLYGADMTIILTYLKCLDDWHDDHKTSAYFLAQRLKKHYHCVKEKYPQKIASIEQALARNAELEAEKCSDLDLLAAQTGILMKEIFVAKDDEWKASMSVFGDYLGRFIYLMDAYDDLQEDKEKQQFNPLIAYEKKDDFDEWMKEILELMMAASAAAFERLPILQYHDILRNIIYSGVWAKYEAVKKKRLGDNNAGSI